MNDKKKGQDGDEHFPHSPIIPTSIRKAKLTDLTLQQDFTIQKDDLVVYFFGGHYGMMHKIRWTTVHSIDTPTNINFSTMEGIGDE